MSEIHDWIRSHFQPTKSAIYSCGALSLKHCCERDLKQRVTHKNFRQAMVDCGYQPVRQTASDGPYYRLRYPDWFRNARG
jgi:hypothetical protein